MALTMRATGLGHGVYKVDVDYSVFSGEWLKARPPENSGSTSSLDAAKAEFKSNWLRFAGWSGQGGLDGLSPCSRLSRDHRKGQRRRCTLIGTVLIDRAADLAGKRRDQFQSRTGGVVVFDSSTVIGHTQATLAVADTRD